MFNFAFLLEPAPVFDFTWIIMLVLIVGMFIFMNRSNKKREKEAADMRDNLQVGDEVTTIGGIIGKVVSIKEETFVLETTKDRTKIRFLKGAIRSVDVKIADVTAAMMETREVSAESEESEKKEAPEKEAKTDKK